MKTKKQSFMLTPHSGTLLWVIILIIIIFILPLKTRFRWNFFLLFIFYSFLWKKTDFNLIFTALRISIALDKFILVSGCLDNLNIFHLFFFKDGLRFVFWLKKLSKSLKFSLSRDELIFSPKTMAHNCEVFRLKD